MNCSVYKALWGKEVPELRSCRVRLKTYTGRKVNVLGAAVVQDKQLVKNFALIVVAGSGPSLVGRYWIGG